MRGVGGDDECGVASLCQLDTQRSRRACLAYTALATQHVILALLACAPVVREMQTFPEIEWLWKAPKIWRPQNLGFKQIPHEC